MKKNKLLFGALALLAFTACSDDKNVNAPQDVLTDGSESYITVRIMDVNSLNSRADAQFENGNENAAASYDESKINSLTVAFYSSEKNFITLGRASEIDFQAPNQNNGGNIETIAEVTVKLTLKPSDPIPAYAIAFANPINDTDASLSTIDATRTKNREQYCTPNNGENLFAMNNSVYFDASGNEVVATPVSRENFFKGNNSGGVPAVDFYIERIAGKVVLKSNDSQDITKLPFKEEEYTLIGEGGEETKYSFKFVPKKWCLNAEEKSTNLMKDFGGEKFTTINSNLDWDDNVKWNDPENKRCYWTRSVSWDKNNIPDVSDDVFGNEGSYGLVYHSYNYAINNGVTVGTPLYTFENTKQSTNYGKNAALVSAIIVGEYVIKSGSGEAKAETFYRRNGQFFSLDGYYSKMAAAQYLIGTVADNTFTALSAAELKAVTKVDHPASNGTDKYRENEVTIQFDKAKAISKLNDLYFRVSEKEWKKYSELSEEWTEDKINEELLKQCGLTEVYTDGKAYFNIPIQHLGRKITKEENGKKTETLSAGYYGIVRNHTYDITVSKVEDGAFGNGVFKENKPIVPPTDTDDYNFKANIKVLAWRIVTHNVTLGE
ncbi:MAG: fimbria major subunit [Muribaculum sp.]|nr:fimbria major subunit [Muribaculum sp.]